MRKKNYKGRCEKQALDKFTTICKTYDPKTDRGLDLFTFNDGESVLRSAQYERYLERR